MSDFTQELLHHYGPSSSDKLTIPHFSQNQFNNLDIEMTDMFTMPQNTEQQISDLESHVLDLAGIGTWADLDALPTDVNDQCIYDMSVNSDAETNYLTEPNETPHNNSSPHEPLSLGELDKTSHELFPQCSDTTSPPNLASDTANSDLSTPPNITPENLKNVPIANGTEPLLNDSMQQWQQQEIRKGPWSQLHMREYRAQLGREIASRDETAEHNTTEI